MYIRETSYSLHTSPLSDTRFAKIPSYSVAALIFLTVSFEEPMFVLLMLSCLPACSIMEVLLVSHLTHL